MTNLIITENVSEQENLLYVQSAISEIAVHAGCSVRLNNISERAILTVNYPEQYSDIIKAEIVDKVAEIIAIKYKYDFFKKNLKIAGLSKVEKEILITSLIAADLDDDKKYSFQKIKNDTVIAVDGSFNFKLKALKKKWQDVLSCVPECFLNSQLKEFISFLLENKNKRVYIDGGLVYDSHYRRLKRSSLFGDESVKIVREVLLSNCGEIELNGNIPKEDEFYLKEYYIDKIIFSGGYIT
ncbi:MAG: hypothetical protein IKB67_05510 [Clostridia bacterium]|nr:hypothetical protein [Clostridia bacterium]